MKKYFIAIILASLLVTCTDNFEEYNEDRKQPLDVPGESLFSNALKDLADQVSSTDVNLNIFKLFAQYWTETTYTDEANYDLINRTIPDNVFEVYYVDVLQDFKQAAQNIQEDVDTTSETGMPEMQNKLAIIELLVCYSYQQLVDIFGDIPYTEALDIENVSPVYDDDAVIYPDLIQRVQAAISQLNEEYGSFGASDFIYEGDAALWKKFGNSLLIKLAINMADVNPGLSQSTIEAAVPGAFTSAGDNALFPYQTASPNYNPIYDDLVASGRNDFVAANTIVDIMNSINDPRIGAYFEPVSADTFVGGIYGSTSPYSQYSHISDELHDPTFPGLLMTYDEIQFYLAEAAARGFNVGATDEELYNSAIAASFELWNIPEDSLTTYLANPAVAWGTAEGDWKQKIGTQEWIAFYSRGLEGYTAWRRLDYPVLNTPESVEGDYSLIPKRFTYPVNEQTLNRENWQAASEAIGGDEMTTPVFWDIIEPTAGK